MKKNPQNNTAVQAEKNGKEPSEVGVWGLLPIPLHKTVRALLTHAAFHSGFSYISLVLSVSRTISYIFHFGWNCHTGQFITLGKRTSPNTLYTTWNLHVLQFTSKESIIPNGCHTWLNFNVVKFSPAVVFIPWLIPPIIISHRTIPANSQGLAFYFPGHTFPTAVRG